MKFWKTLNSLIEQTLPDWRDKFLSYKDLKKQLKLICPKDAVSVDQNHSDTPDNRSGERVCINDDRPLRRSQIEDGAASFSDERGTIHKAAATAPSKEVNEFVKLLENEIEKFNAFFVDKEEEYVIRLKELQDRKAKANDSAEKLMRIGREIVDFHGEMVLLENYSALSYTGLVKILKKYDKRSRTLLRLPFIQNVLQQSFYSNEILCKLEKDCEAMLEQLFAKNDFLESSAESSKMIKGSPGSVDTIGAGKGSSDSKEKIAPLTVPKELSEIESMERMYYKLTLSALRVLKEMRSGSSTVSVFSLPPLQSSPQDEEIWKKISVQEQAAK